jgi:peroxiredoxin
MKPRFLIAAAVLTLSALPAVAGEGGKTAAAAAATSATQALALGSEAPMASTKMKSVTGKSLSIADVEGKNGTLVVFTCNACPFVKSWQERIAALGHEAMNRGIGVIAINPNDPARNAEDGFAEMQKRSKKLGLKFNYVVDATSDVARAFGATRTPEVFLFDKSGKLVYHGAVDDNAHQPDQVSERYLKNAIDAVVAGESVPVAETKSIGCTIKFRTKA